MTQRRTRATQYQNELEAILAALNAILTPPDDPRYAQHPNRLAAWYTAIGEHHSHGYRPTSYEPAVQTSSEPPIPTVDQDDHRIEQETRLVWQRIRAARTALDEVHRLTRARTTPTRRPDDPDTQPCTNPNCTTLFSMIGRDRPHGPDGRCEACRKWFARKGVEWAPRQGATE